jgi:hypothetical protein
VSTVRTDTARRSAGLDRWSDAFVFGGLPYTRCAAGDGRIGPGQWAKAEGGSGRLWHDDCAEDAGAYAR